MTSPDQTRIALTKFVVGALTTTVLVASVAAQPAYTTRYVNLRAGPDRGYPQVAYIGPNQSVYVNGCLNDYRWCDITVGSNRGWAYSKYIEYPYQNRRLPIYGNGQMLALPIVGFILGSYWNDNYSSRPWYGQQNNWNNWRPGNRPPGYGNGYRPQPQPPRPPIAILPPRPPIVRPEPPRPPRPQILPPRPQPAEGLPGFVKPGPNSPAAQR